MNKKKGQIDFRKLTYVCGFLGSTIIIVCTLITVFHFKDSNGESYSFLNQFISELGQTGISTSATVFNTGLKIGGAFLALFMLGLGLYLKSKFTYFTAAIGALSMIGAILVGVFPMNINFNIHSKVALLFFRGGLITILLFTLYVIFSKQNKLPKLIIIPGIVTILAVISFLCLHSLLNPQHTPILGPLINRPVFYPQSFLEWIVFFSMFLWIGSVSLCLFINNPKKNKH